MKISRRDLIKTTIAGAALIGTGQKGSIVARADELIYGGKQVSRTTGQEQIKIPSTCLQCYARCGILAYLDGDRLVKIAGNPEHPNSRTRLCAKGQAGINFVYDPDRILYPMKRTGKRGEKKWKRISWNEALEEIAEKLKQIRSKGKPEEFIIQSERDVTSTSGFVRRFMHAYGSPNALVSGFLGGANKRLALKLTLGTEVDINDVAYTHYILNFGSNPYEAHLLRTSFAQRLVEGRSVRFFDGRVHNRAKIVTFDVRVSQTAGRSDEWHPIFPGTDGLVALAMSNVIIKEGLYDGAFVERWCNYPVEKLKMHLSKYTPEMAEKISGVPEGDIKRIAIEFATTKPATTISTGGSTKHKNGVYNERCIALLNAITGNIDVKGGYCIPVQYRFSEPDPVPPIPSVKSELINPSIFPLLEHEVAELVLPMIRDKKAKAGVYMIYHYNPVYSEPEGKTIAAEILKDENLIPFFVVIDSFMTETAVFADIILPQATYLEVSELDSPPAYERIPFISFRQPVLKLPGEVKSINDILLDLSKRIGGGMENYFKFENTEKYHESLIRNIDGLKREGGLEYLKKHGVWYDKKVKPEYKIYEKNGFPTQSKKFEIYSSIMAKNGHEPLPVYIPIPEHSRLKEDEFVMTIFQWNVHTHSWTANCMLLSEILHTNPLIMNSESAGKRGIKTGDKVKIISGAGEIITNVIVLEGIHPKVVAISDNCGHWEFGKIARAKKFKSEEPDTNIIWWERHGNGVHPKPIIPVSPDPIGGGQAWMDTVVKVSKVEESHEETKGFLKLKSIWR